MNRSGAGQCFGGSFIEFMLSSLKVEINLEYVFIHMIGYIYISLFFNSFIRNQLQLNKKAVTFVFNPVCPINLQ